MPQIRVKNGKQKGKVLSLNGQNRLLIGRDNSCGLQILDQGVSREHAEIFSVGEMVFIRDMGSRNGSFVNDERIEEELLREGDVVRVGNTQLLFESTKEAREGDLEFEEDDQQPFKTSLDLKMDDLYVGEGAGRESDMFKAICQATSIIQSERDDKKLFERLLDLSQEYIPADHLYLFLRDEATGSITPRAMRQTTEKKNVPISRSILRRVITESRAILTADAMQDDRFKADDSIVMNQIRAVLCVPIQSGGQAVGAIYAVNSSLTDTFEQSDVQLLSAMGSQLAMAMENLNLMRGRRRTFLRTIGRLVSLLQGATPGQRGRAERVCSVAGAIAAEIGLTENQVLFSSLAGLLHDIGKVSAVAQSSAGTSAPDPSLAHLSVAMEFLKDIPGLHEALPGICAQHERYDGSGKPDGLAGEKIPLAARIVAVARDFDSRIYPNGASNPDAEPDAALVKKAFTELDQQSGSVYDSNVVRALIVSYRHGALRANAQDGNARVSSVRLEAVVKPIPAIGVDAPTVPVAAGSQQAYETNTTVRAKSAKKK